MILLIDNYDSFSYNLVQMAGSIRPDIKVIRNDAMTVEEVRELKPDHIILSPGPGYPKDAGICEMVVKELAGEIPIMGVCLGHQAICEVYGGMIAHAKELMHGSIAVSSVSASPSVSRSSSVFTNAGISPVSASPRSWNRHIFITLSMSQSGNSSFTSHANTHSRYVCSATLSRL